MKKREPAKALVIELGLQSSTAVKVFASSRFLSTISGDGSRQSIGPLAIKAKFAVKGLAEKRGILKSQ